MRDKVLYFDQVTEGFESIFDECKPETVDLLFWDKLTDHERAEILPIVDYLMVATKIIPKEILEAATKAKLIQKTGVGVDNIDVAAASELGLPIANTPRANTTGVAELTILFILSLYRKLPVLDASMKDGKWEMWNHRPSSYEMSGKTHGLIGFGNVGQETARRSKAFGTTIVYYDAFQLPSKVEEELGATHLPFDEVLKRSDIVSLHVPLFPETKGLINKEQLKLMKDNAILINVSRGGIVDESALSDALKNGVIGGAGIDVWENEPPVSGHPLLKLDNVIATPHIGAGTRDTLKKVLEMAFGNIARVSSGEAPSFIVNEIKKAR